MNYIYQGSNNPYLQEKKHKDLLSKNYGTFPEYITNIRNDLNNVSDVSNISNISNNVNNDISSNMSKDNSNKNCSNKK
jgi:3-methyladenine DNA glycosylase Tag